MTLRLVIFDVDGTLVDSQQDIVGGMQHAFRLVDLTSPSPDAILSIVGLSLPEAMARLAPETTREIQGALVARYKETYAKLRLSAGSKESSPLYPGARGALERLHAVPEVLLAVATGRSRRGLELLLDAHDLRRFFVSLQHADSHPSKPHPSMLLAALAETGVSAEAAIMVGDSSFDMDMARSAGIMGIGVAWGYQPVTALSAAATVVADWDALLGEIARRWGIDI